MVYDNSWLVLVLVLGLGLVLGLVPVLVPVLVLGFVAIGYWLVDIGYRLVAGG
jgi:hypothetical protein